MEFADYIPTPKVNGVWCSDGRPRAISGTLCLTGHHMILYADETKSGEVWILYKNIDSIEKRFGLDKGTIVVKCKDFRQIQLTIPGVEDATNVAYSAEILSSITDPTLQYPYFYRQKFKVDENGWDLYKIEEHLAQLNLRGERWRISDINSGYNICQSYPSYMIVPKSIDDQVLQRSAKFRQLGRFPALSYCHKNGAVLLRSSQPLLSTGNRRSRDDEKLVNAMLGPEHRGYVLDIRSLQSAANAKSKGGGYEIEHHYPRWKRIHKNLHSYYSQQESFIRVVEASKDKASSMDRWLSKLESSNWMGYVKKAMDAACLVAQCIDREQWSVLVHGSEGFDSTLTVTSLTQVILDPECRTIRGFLMLIDREWIRAGHPFQERSAHGPYSNAKQRSEGPVFSIFLECVFQLICQFPLSFEFTSSLLVDLRTHSYASEFGTFLFNSMLERARGKLQTKTVSLWSYVLSPAVFHTFVNPLYRRQNKVIWPSVAPQSLEFWEELFTPELSPGSEVLERVRAFEEERMELEWLVAKLREVTGDAPVLDTMRSLNLVEPMQEANKISSAEVDSKDNIASSTLVCPNGLEDPSSGLTYPGDSTDTSEGQASRSQFYISVSEELSPKSSHQGGFIVENDLQRDILGDLAGSRADPASPSLSKTGENGDGACHPDLIDLGVIALDSNESSSNSPDAVSPVPS